MWSDQSAVATPSRRRQFLCHSVCVYCGVFVFHCPHCAVVVRGESFHIPFDCDVYVTKHKIEYSADCRRHVVPVRLRGSHHKRTEWPLEGEQPGPFAGRRTGRRRRAGGQRSGNDANQCAAIQPASQHIDCRLEPGINYHFSQQQKITLNPPASLNVVLNHFFFWLRSLYIP